MSKITLELTKDELETLSTALQLDFSAFSPYPYFFDEDDKAHILKMQALRNKINKTLYYVPKDLGDSNGER